MARTIAADPVGTALLLAGPAAVELWPGATLLAEVGGRALVEATLPAGDGAPAGPPLAACVRALPPRRTPTSFRSTFTWSGPGLPLTQGTLTLAYAAGSHGLAATYAVLVLDSEAVPDSRMSARSLAAMAEGFLANLAHLAEERSDAA